MNKFTELANQIHGLDVANEYEDLTVSGEWLISAVDALHEAAELEAQLKEAVKANHVSQLIGERNAFRRVSAMNVDGWLKQKMKSEIERVTRRIEEIEKDQDHE